MHREARWAHLRALEASDTRDYVECPWPGPWEKGTFCAQGLWDCSGRMPVKMALLDCWSPSKFTSMFLVSASDTSLHPCFPRLDLPCGLYPGYLLYCAQRDGCRTSCGHLPRPQKSLIAPRWQAVVFKSWSAGPLWALGLLLRGRGCLAASHPISNTAEPFLSVLHIYWASTYAFIWGRVSTPKIEIVLETTGHRIKSKFLSSVFNVYNAPAQKLANFSPQAKSSQLLRRVLTIFYSGYILSDRITPSIFSSVLPLGLCSLTIYSLALEENVDWSLA